MHDCFLKDINVDVHVVINDVHERWRRDISPRGPLAKFASTVNRFNDWNESHLHRVRQAIVAAKNSAVILTRNLLTPPATPWPIRNQAISTQGRRRINQHIPREIFAPRSAAILLRTRKRLHSHRALRHRALTYLHPLPSRNQKAPRIKTRSAFPPPLLLLLLLLQQSATIIPQRRRRALVLTRNTKTRREAGGDEREAEQRREE